MNNVFINTLLLFSLLFLSLSSCSEKEKRRVLVVHSYEDSYVAYPDFDRMIAERFKKEKISAEIRTIYLDCESFQEKAELKRMTFLLDSITKDWKPEIILVNEDQATYSLLKCNHSLVKEVPIVFSGVNYPNWDLIKQYPNVTGLHDKIAFVENIKMGNLILGDRMNFFTIVDFTYLDRQIRADAKEQFKGHKVTGFFDYPDLSLKEQMKLVYEKGYVRLQSVSFRSYQKNGASGLMWALSKYSRHNCYVQLKRDFTTVNIGNISVSPSITVINEGFGYNEKLLGGYITSLPIQIEEEVKVAARILHGVNPSDIPIVESRKEYIIDWEVMQKLGISKNKIPANYSIIHIPFNKKYPVLWLISVMSIVAILVTLFILIFGLYLREQKRKKGALNALANEKENLALAIEGGTTYVWRLKDELFIFEDAFWSSLGMMPKSLTFADLLVYIHPDHWEDVKLSWENLPYTQKKITQLRCDFNGMGYQWWEFRYTTKQLSEGENKTAGLILNIQAIKDREAELEEARLLAEKAELKQSFLANMSHEIRTPLNSIVGFANILAVDDELSVNERAEYIDTINKNSELLLKLINDILELSRMESGFMSFSYEKCLVSDLINDVYMTHQVLIKPQIEFLKEVAEIPLEINVDKDRLTQVLTNFLNNASKFTEKGYIKIGFNYLSDKNRVCIFVEDSGKGIPREEQKIIFSRFYKQNEFSQGAGLGLSICQVIIEKLGGTIELQSELGKGSIFLINLPCRVVD